MASCHLAMILPSKNCKDFLRKADSLIGSRLFLLYAFAVAKDLCSEVFSYHGQVLFHCMLISAEFYGDGCNVYIPTYGI